MQEKLGTEGILLKDNERMRLARLAKRPERSALADARPFFSPAPILRWHGDLIARTYDDATKRTPGRKGISDEVEKQIILYRPWSPTAAEANRRAALLIARTVVPRYSHSMVAGGLLEMS